MIKKDEYINEVTALIKNKTVRNDVKKELEAHIDDRTQYYLDAGYDEEISVKRAVEMMGRPDEVAKSLEKLHNNTLWIVLASVFLGVYIFGLIYAAYNMGDFAYINLVDFAETDAGCSVISIATFCAAAISFGFAKKSQSVGILKAFGIITIILSIVSFYVLRPAGYHFISVFTDFPTAIKTNSFFFGSEAFYDFVNIIAPYGEVLSGLSLFIFIALIILTLAVASIHIVTGILSLVYAKKLRREENCGEYEHKLSIFMSLLIVICIITVIGTGAEIARDELISIRYQQEYDAHKDEYYTEAKAKFDSIKLPVSKEDALILADECEYLSDSENSKLSLDTFYTVYNMYNLSVNIYDNDYDGIYEAKRFVNHDAYDNGIDKESLKKLETSTSIEDLYNIADFSNFISYTESKSVDGTHIEIYICEKKNRYEYLLEYTNGKLTYSTIGNDRLSDYG